MPMTRPLFSVRRMMVVTAAVAVALGVFRWMVAEVFHPREYTYCGNTFISSRKLTSKDYKKDGTPLPWYFVEPNSPKME